MSYTAERPNSDLRRSLVFVTTAGCLAMVYMAGTVCPLMTRFFLDLGATEGHFGLITGIPMALISLQVVGALITNRLERRKPFFIVIHIAGRLLFLAVAFLPLVWAPADNGLLIGSLILFIAVSSCCWQIGSPIFFSWIADLVPHRILNRYWGVRHRSMMVAWVGSFLAVSAFTYFVAWPVGTSYRVVVTVAVLAGVTDILLFLRVREPAHETVRGTSVFRIVLEPLRDPDYRKFALFWSAWIASVMCASAFMQVYALKVLGMSVWEATLAWCMLGLGAALGAPRWGRLADRHGNRPVLITALLIKPCSALVFVLVTPDTALFVLPLWFIFDGTLNSGVQIGSNGYMLKMSPRRNRAMFIGSIVGLGGIAGGISAVLAGQVLELTAGFAPTFFGRTWNNYQVVFAASFLLRCGCLPFSFRIREPKTTAANRLLVDIVMSSPLRLLRYPVGLLNDRSDEDDQPA